MSIFNLHNVYKQASDIVSICTEGQFAIIDENGYPKVATRSCIKATGINELYFSSNVSGHLIQSILNNPKSSVCFEKDGNNITLVGTAQLVNDPEVKKNLWLDWFINHYPGGLDDPDYGIIKFTTEYVSLWMDRKVYKFDVADLKQITSRCGLMCNSCEWKVPNNCKGCIASSGNPFYGTCRIATCAQEKELLHCGLCDEMPCELLKEFSCGDGEHCDIPKGARIEVLKMWAEIPLE